MRPARSGALGLALLLGASPCAAEFSFLGLQVPTTFGDLRIDLPVNFSNFSDVGGLFQADRFGSMLFSTRSNRTLGNCDARGQQCDWDAYWWSVWYAGLWAWIVAAAMLAFLLLFSCLRICCCCCVCIVDAVFSCLCFCFRGCCSTANDCCIWLTRLLVLLVVGVGSTGFAFAVMGWMDAEQSADYVYNNFTLYLSSDLPATVAQLGNTLTMANSALGAVEQMTNQSGLAAPLTPGDIGLANRTLAGIWTNWTTDQEPLVTNLRRAWFFLFWVAIVAPLATLAIILFLGAIARCSCCPSALAMLGFLATALIWAAIGVTGSGICVIGDTCKQTQRILAAPANGSVLLPLLHCTQPAAANEFSGVAASYKGLSQQAYEGACGSVRPACSQGAMSCPALPASCTSLSQVAPLPYGITLRRSAAAGGCNASCTAAACADVCTGAALMNASRGLVYSTQAALLLNATTIDLLIPLVTCEYLAKRFIVMVNLQCTALQEASNQMIWGMFTLAVASFLGSCIAMLFAPWFSETSSDGSDSRKKHSPTNPLSPPASQFGHDA